MAEEGSRQINVEHNNYLQNTEWGMKARLKLVTQGSGGMVNSLSLEIFLIKTDLKDVIIQKKKLCKITMGFIAA